MMSSAFGALFPQFKTAALLQNRAAHNWHCAVKFSRGKHCVEFEMTS